MVAEFFAIVKSDAFNGHFARVQSLNASFRHRFGGAIGDFGNHCVATGYASFCGSFDAAQKTYDSYMKKYFDNYFMIMPTTEITQSEFKAIKAKINLINQALVEAN
jgi:hypothetical protein